MDAVTHPEFEVAGWAIGPSLVISLTDDRRLDFAPYDGPALADLFDRQWPKCEGCGYRRCGCAVLRVRWSARSVKE
jgi:hypothetical protein